MTEIYRKRGRVVRVESGYLVETIESGEAIENGSAFSCAPIELPALPGIDSARVLDIVSRIEAHVVAPVVIERLIVSEGIAEHEFGGVQWSERSVRIHLSLVHRDARVLIDLGDDVIDDVITAADALRRLEGERECPARLRLTPAVSAALLPTVGSDVRLFQWPAADRRDGKGALVERCALDHEPWPNWFRPSYRSLPVRTPFDIRAECDSAAVGGEVATAVAIMAPVSGRSVRVLCVDRAAVYATTADVVTIEAAGPAIAWYPYSAGVWGAEMIVCTKLG